MPTHPRSSIRGYNFRLIGPLTAQIYAAINWTIKGHFLLFPVNGCKLITARDALEKDILLYTQLGLAFLYLPHLSQTAP